MRLLFLAVALLAAGLAAAAMAAPSILNRPEVQAELRRVVENATGAELLVRGRIGVDVLPAPWRTVTLFNPVVYLINGFRWTFFGVSDVGVVACLAVTGGFFLLCLGAIVLIFRTVWRLKS